MKHFTFYYDNNPLLIFPKVAEMLGLKDGYRIKTEAEFWKILSANASYGISICESTLSNKLSNN